MLLRTEHLTKDYDHHRALDDLNLTVDAGEVVGLLGPNGSGKSTALRLLLGFLRPTAGHAWIGGHDCWHESVAARRLLAYLPGELRLYENMNGRRLIHFLGQLRGQPIDPAALDDLAHRFDIDLDQPIASLSSGMKRKVALLEVLVPLAIPHGSIRLLIMDEPTNTLDPTMRDELLEQVRLARDRGQAILFSSHVLAEVEAVCDRVAILRHGRLVHLQSLHDMQQGRLIHVRLHAAAELLPDLPGLRVRDQQPDRLTLEYTGPLPELLPWLLRQPIEDLRMEPLGLSAIYARYHASEA